MIKVSHPLNIIYLCTAEKGPSGGAKIIYDHSKKINKLNIKNLSSAILHIRKKKIQKWNTSIKIIFNLDANKYSGWNIKDIGVYKNFKSKWFKNNIKIKNDLVFDKKEDFVIFPEIFAHFAEELCIQNKIPYGIFVQNGYCLNPTNDFKKLEKVYKHAKFILSCSKDITDCINLAFPFQSKKILRTNISIDTKKFNHNRKKKNLITYMPRKLPSHSDNLTFFLRNKLPKSWKFKSLHNMRQKEVYKYLLKSKIFLSFSDMEGLGVPPIEAAIAGNKVIGYTGRGGGEYWKNPIFTEIPHGDISRFIKEILKNIKEKNLLKNLSASKRKIAEKFSPDQEKKQIIKMINKITSII